MDHLRGQAELHADPAHLVLEQLRGIDADGTYAEVAPTGGAAYWIPLKLTVSALPMPRTVPLSSRATALAASAGVAATTDQVSTVNKAFRSIANLQRSSVAASPRGKPQVMQYDAILRCAAFWQTLAHVAQQPS